MDLDLCVAHEQVGAIIGSGGASVKLIRESSGANVGIDKAMLPGSNERKVTLSGSSAAISSAVLQLSVILAKVRMRWSSGSAGPTAGCRARFPCRGSPGPRAPAPRCTANTLSRPRSPAAARRRTFSADAAEGFRPVLQPGCTGTRCVWRHASRLRRTAGVSPAARNARSAGVPCPAGLRPTRGRLPSRRALATDANLYCQRARWADYRAWWGDNQPDSANVPGQHPHWRSAALDAM